MALTIRRPSLHFLASLLLIPVITGSAKAESRWVYWLTSPVSASNGNSHFSDDTTCVRSSTFL